MRYKGDYSDEILNKEQTVAIRDLTIGKRINLFKEGEEWIVRARSTRYIVLTNNYAGNNYYTVMDLERNCIGKDNKIFSDSYVTDYDCEQRLLELEKRVIEVSWKSVGRISDALNIQL